MGFWVLSGGVDFRGLGVGFRVQGGGFGVEGLKSSLLGLGLRV